MKKKIVVHRDPNSEGCVARLFWVLAGVAVPNFSGEPGEIYEGYGDTWFDAINDLVSKFINHEALGLLGFFTKSKSVSRDRLVQEIMSPSSPDVVGCPIGIEIDETIRWRSAA